MHNDEQNERYLNRTTKDTYEAAYYLLSGGKLARVRSTPVPKNKVKRKGYAIQWIMHITGVPESAVVKYQTGRAVVEVGSFANSRRSLKRWVKRLLTQP